MVAKFSNIQLLQGESITHKLTYREIGLQVMTFHWEIDNRYIELRDLEEEKPRILAQTTSSNVK